jgi:DNA-directed RNA polymerase specialized sigma24 family protein
MVYQPDEFELNGLMRIVKLTAHSFGLNDEDDIADGYLHLAEIMCVIDEDRKETIKAFVRKCLENYFAKLYNEKRYRQAVVFIGYSDVDKLFAITQYSPEHEHMKLYCGELCEKLANEDDLLLIRLHFFEGLSLAQCAQRMNRTYNATKQRLYRALQKMRV